jgi:hypothetical protein
MSRRILGPGECRGIEHQTLHLVPTTLPARAREVTQGDKVGWVMSGAGGIVECREVGDLAVRSANQHGSGTSARRATLRVRLEGDTAELGRIPAADVAQLLLMVEKALARAASVVVGRPSRKPGRRERVIDDAAHVVLRAIEPGSVIPVLELPGVDSDEIPQENLPVDVAHLGELAAAQIFDIVAEEIDGHPYVVEALSELSTKLRVGERYDSVGFEISNSAVPRRRVTLDVVSSRRLRDRVRLDKAAARQGMLAGTLVEADFESYTARLRSPEGQPVAVSFDPSMADNIHEALREPATVDGWITYDPASQEARSISLHQVMRADQTSLRIDSRAFQRRKTFADLQEEQGTTGLFDVNDLHDSISSEEELEAYEEALQRLVET